ncbi:SH3 domain protein [Salmonella phage SSBI34]|nr:SH3 domain protein [Salmonella phage SSBI34]
MTNMIALTEKRNALENILAKIKEKQAEIDSFEYESSTSEYDDSLDSEGEITVAGMTFWPSDILKNCDPTAYRCGKVDYDSSKDLDDVEEYQELQEELEELENERDDLESEIEELEEEDEE